MIETYSRVFNNQFYKPQRSTVCSKHNFAWVLFSVSQNISKGAIVLCMPSVNIYIKECVCDISQRNDSENYKELGRSNL